MAASFEYDAFRKKLEEYANLCDDVAVLDKRERRGATGGAGVSTPLTWEQAFAKSIALTHQDYLKKAAALKLDILKNFGTHLVDHCVTLEKRLVRMEADVIKQADDFARMKATSIKQANDVAGLIAAIDKQQRVFAEAKKLGYGRVVRTEQPPTARTNPPSGVPGWAASEALHTV